MDLIAFLLFSAGSRFTFTQSGDENKKQTKKELEENYFSVCLVRW